MSERGHVMSVSRQQSIPQGVVGLSSVEARKRLLAGRNVVVPETRAHRWRRWLGPLLDPMVLLLLVAIPVYLAIGEQRDAIVTTVALVPIIAVGWYMESRANNALEKLHQLTAMTVWAIRDGRWLEVLTEELVPGDVIEVVEGSVVPADGAMIFGSQLQIDESSLTGESLHLNKSLEDPLVFAGTVVVAGRALIEVALTGAATRYGQVAALLKPTSSKRTPLQDSLVRLVRVIAVIASACALLVLVIEVRAGHGWAAAAIAAISLLIAALPEEFSLVYSLYLALGAWRLAREKALVRNLPGVETLGSVTVICTDKTGTLTEGALEVHSIESLHLSHTEFLERALRACEPQPFDPLDKAIASYATNHAVSAQLLEHSELVLDWPFDPHGKYVTHVWQLAADDFIIASKGSLEGLIEVCGPELPELTQLEASNHALAAMGMRVIAVATARVSVVPSSRADAEAHLELAGLIGFRDPIKPKVGEALEACRTAGIRVILITGDHPTTADAVASELGLRHRDGTPVHVALGKEMDGLSDAELDELIRDTDVFARTRPDQKHLLISSLQRAGEVVAMTGDGVNDAPALQQADIGVVMGIRGTDVAREAATIVLLDDNFATIVAATRNGRLIYDNLSKAFRYLIAVHVPLVFIALVVPIMGLPLLLLPVHLIVLEILLHPIVSLVFQAEPAAPNIMNRPPRRPGFALSPRALALPALSGVSVSAAVIGMYRWALSTGLSEFQARGASFTVLLLCQAVLMVSTRSSRLPLWRVWVRPTRQLWAGWAALGLTLLAMVSVPEISRLLAVAPFPWSVTPMIVGLVVVSTLWTEAAKWLRRP